MREILAGFASFTLLRACAADTGACATAVGGRTIKITTIKTT